MSSRLSAPPLRPLQAPAATATSAPASAENAAERARSAAWQRWKMGDVAQARHGHTAATEQKTELATELQAGLQTGLNNASHNANLSAGLYGADGSPPPQLKVHAPLSPLQPGLLMDEAELVRLRQMAQAAGHAEGWREGHALGLQQGREAGLAENRHAAAEWAALTRGLPLALAEADAALAAELVTLAMSLARQVLGQSLALQPDAVLAAVRELLNAEPALTGQPQLWLHPDDAALVKAELPEELQAAGWRVRTDAQLARGGCRVLAASGEIDATLPTRWARLASFLGPTHD